MKELGLYSREYKFCFYDTEADDTFYRYGSFATTPKAKDYARHILGIYRHVDMVTISKVHERKKDKIWKVVNTYHREDLIKINSVKNH